MTLARLFRMVDKAAISEMQNTRIARESYC